MNIFTFPTKGEIGGAPSGTEQYFSMDHGIVHLVSLDSQLANADPDARLAILNPTPARSAVQAQAEHLLMALSYPPLKPASPAVALR